MGRYYSILRDMFLEESAKQNKRHFDIIVSKDGGGDYTELTEALADGHRNIFIRRGTYDLSGSVVLEHDEELILVGEGSDLVEIRITETDGANLFDFMEKAVVRANKAVNRVDNTGENAKVYVTAPNVVAGETVAFVNASSAKWHLPGVYDVLSVGVDYVEIRGKFPAVADNIDTNVMSPAITSMIHYDPEVGQGMWMEGMTFIAADPLLANCEVFVQAYTNMKYHVIDDCKFLGFLGTAYPFYEGVYAPWDKIIMRNSVIDMRGSAQGFDLYFGGIFENCHFYASDPEWSTGYLANNWYVGEFRNCYFEGCILGNPWNYHMNQVSHLKNHTTMAINGRYENCTFARCASGGNVMQSLTIAVNGCTGDVSEPFAYGEPIIDMSSMSFRSAGKRTIKVTADRNITPDIGTVLVDTTGGPVTLTFPRPHLTPVNGSVEIIDVGGAFATNNCTLARTSNIGLIDGGVNKALNVNNSRTSVFAELDGNYITV